jgi:hypothetical protein
VSGLPTLPPRLFVILARRAPVGVIFRRGPSRQVLLIRWDTARDRFETGQWFKGRIYERRCDLSPGGEKLLYFAASFRKPLYSWTAISRPPYLTALAVWPKGDTWNGGGQFATEHDIVLNHPRGQAEPDPGRPAPKVRIVQYATARGEDDTVYWPLLERNGWRRRPAEAWPREAFEVWARPRVRSKLTLEMAVVGVRRRPGAWYRVEYRIVDERRQSEEWLGLLDWADWDHAGHLVFARAGCLFRRPVVRGRPGAPVQLADFSALAFEPVVAPEWARSW